MANFGNWGGVPRYLSAEEAAARLGVSRRTLYVYVSRRLVRSKADGSSHKKAYLETDIQRLMQRKRAGRRPSIAARAALDWGMPVLDSAITLIDRSHIWYRGRNATDVARTASVENVARLLWDCGEFDPFAAAAAVLTRAPRRRRNASAMGRCLEALAGACESPSAAVAEPAGLWTEAAQLLRLLYAAAAGRPVTADPLDRVIALGMGRPRATDVLRRALILCADHELSTSAFSVRCAASTEGPLAAALLAGLAAFQGPAQGGAPEEVEKLIEECVTAGDARKAVAARLERGSPLPGFGHKLHPLGDARAVCMLENLRLTAEASAVADAIHDAVGLQPNVAFALAALRRSLRLPRGSALILYTCGRAIGWAAHAIEQRLSGELIRPRALYTGPVPGR
jgi:citrate synthase